MSFPLKISLKISVTKLRTYYNKYLIQKKKKKTVIEINGENGKIILCLFLEKNIL